MTKAAPKSARVNHAPQGSILYCENDAGVLKEQAKMFERAGYAVQCVQGRAAVEQALRTGSYGVVVLGHTLTKDDRHHLPYMAKKSSAHPQVLVLHASGKHPAVDVAIDSRDGEKAVLAALHSLAQERLLVAS
jgi:DNA-binding NtrC family response regulator